MICGYFFFHTMLSNFNVTHFHQNVLTTNFFHKCYCCFSPSNYKSAKLLFLNFSLKTKILISQISFQNHNHNKFWSHQYERWHVHVSAWLAINEHELFLFFFNYLKSLVGPTHIIPSMQLRAWKLKFSLINVT